MKNDSELAAHLALAAGKLLMDVRDAAMLQGKALGKAGDAIANAFLTEALSVQRPDDGVLTEEARDDGKRLSHERVWIIDPLDGTREYSEGRADWAVHVGLAIGGEAKIGAVAMPHEGRVYATGLAEPVPASPEKPRMVVSRSRPPAEAVAVADAIEAELIPMGSAGAKAMAVLRGEAEIYLHSGGQYEWDSCAPVAVAKAHGLHVSRADGAPLVYNREEPYLPDLLICRPEWAEQVIAIANAP